MLINVHVLLSDLTTFLREIVHINVLHIVYCSNTFNIRMQIDNLKGGGDYS